MEKGKVIHNFNKIKGRGGGGWLLIVSEEYPSDVHKICFSMYTASAPPIPRSTAPIQLSLFHEAANTVVK